ALYTASLGDFARRGVEGGEDSAVPDGIENPLVEQQRGNHAFESFFESPEQDRFDGRRCMAEIKGERTGGSSHMIVPELPLLFVENAISISHEFSCRAEDVDVAVFVRRDDSVLVLVAAREEA